ncbi:MAG: Gfo/Idh/MocA family oxidoreductase [Alphaproteobacteria bacterium]|jgi:predicted dehydrogenase|nr:Gfo/Idh/MocA family oxidoreductase [Alphaproteobacteria bacterium]MDP6813812.1 Gfo/Idh/MocA family oxidoreductase [Alphaproteobacteria bacterium]
MSTSQSENVRIAALGLDHDHVWTVAAEIHARDDATLVAAADHDQELRARAEAQFGVPTYSDHRELLEREELDAVYIYTNNRASAELAIEAASLGLHALVEKPMAANRPDAERMIAASRQNHTRLMINWPFAWWPNLQRAIELVLGEDSVGRLWQVKYRAAHEGIVTMGHSRQFADWVEDAERAGGGALVDYCCYGAVLARVLLGQPDAVCALAGNFCRDDIEVEDNAVILMRYPRAMAMAEASWTQHGKIGAYAPLLYGERGSLLVGPRADGGLLRADLENPAGIEISVPAPPAHLKNATAHFLWGIRTGAPFTALCDPEVCRDATAILDAGLASADSSSVLVEAG